MERDVGDGEREVIDLIWMMNELSIVKKDKGSKSWTTDIGKASNVSRSNSPPEGFKPPIQEDVCFSLPPVPALLINVCVCNFCSLKSVPQH